ncbi:MULTISPECIES: ABC transporter permease subunit [Bradyrhizobium]|jgi:branched-chain amino acid transport system permease protein|uniref:Branched-chain amino acid ABC transporter ATP-binding protein/permease n=6 Tax=Bradyrhizobium TaxID=374 RepID=A0ABS5GDH9_9BRAD|nr:MULTISPECIES: branched-chain amino acid ABC transporter ATP-binding protein/permease [Bradyrhizobium]RTM00774.1 MAG: branched-chain amino acid ABC transporter ATP-binding protein/permease [Bradyrhizobiaceae bacterium]MBR1139398.1 branched-chain amino acid ABC transporter ATP-binding protein/permease [Bradyrhizobium denitrificans]MCL8484606.1 branched-chain amino acid ABC transporter ATP-binding protein/permease [Bradyrhizobium denitrificans]MDU1495984.1 branched-chain amino acid ABC transpor
MTRLHVQLAAMVAMLCLAAAPFLLPPFTITLMNYIGVYSLVAIGLALLTGVGGIVSFGQAAFVGIAAYATAWVSALNGHSPWVGLLLALTLTCSIATLLGLATLRLQGHFLSLSTVAWGLAIGFLFGNVEGLGRFNGIASIPPISFGSYALVSSAQVYFLIWGIVAAVLWIGYNLLDSRLGRAMRALRGGNTLVESLGISAFRIKLLIFVIAAFLAALSGWLYAHMSRFISPGPFDAGMGIEYLMMSMVGGAGSLLGGVVGAAIVTLLKNSVQDYLPLIAKGASGQLEIVAFSALFILFLQWARQGIVPFVGRYLPKLRRDRPQPAPALPRRAQPAPGELLLKVDGAERRFGGLVAVNNVSFDVRSGEILAVIGPNGAGKSTMFNCLTGALRVNKGDIVFAGRSITREAQSRIAKAGIARTFQHVKLRPRMSLLENVMLGTYARTRTGLLASALRLNRREEASAQFEALRQLERVGLGDKPFDIAGNLPLGNQRILEIARALAADPALLVLDEPAAGLRRQEKLRLAELLRSLRNDHLTILIVEHDMEFVMSLVDRIVVLDFGSKLCEGDPAAIRNDERVQEAYLGGVA